MSPLNPLILMVLEDNQADYLLLQEDLKEISTKIGAIHHHETLQDLIYAQDEVHPDVIFIDLNVPDSNGLDTFMAVSNRFPFSAIIILTGLADEEISLQAIHSGAQDYLVKGEFGAHLLDKTIQYGVERKRNQLHLEEAYSRYEILSKATNDAIWDWNLQTNEVIWNDKVSIFGYPPDVIKNADWKENNIHPEDKNSVLKTLEKCFEENCEVWSQQFRFRCFDGRYLDILDRGHVLYDRKKRQYRMIGSMTDISSQVELQKELEKEKAKQQHAVLKASIDGQEKERNEIGMELHDNINQMLASINLCISASLPEIPGQPYLLEKALTITNECIQEVRRLSATLVSPYTQQIRLRETLEELISRVRLKQNMIFYQTIDDAAADVLDKEQALSLYRIVQEQVNNILKHANASTVKINLEKKSREVRMTIADDGKGFDPSAISSGIGMGNMKARATLINGELKFKTAPGKGCTLEIKIPV